MKYKTRVMEDGDKRAYLYQYEKTQRKWTFQMLNKEIVMKGKSGVMSYPLESWVTTETVRYVFSVICYSYEGMVEQVLRHSDASHYHTGPTIYEVTCVDRRVCTISKPFLMSSLKMCYGQDYRIVSDLLSLALLKQEVIYLLKLNVAFCTIYAQLSIGSGGGGTHKETTQTHTTDNECKNKTCP